MITASNFVRHRISKLRLGYDLLRSMSSTSRYDLLIIGSGPSAISCSVDASKRGKKVGIIDKRGLVGGVCVNSGTIPSKTFREAILHLSGYRHKGFYGKAYSVKRINSADIMTRVETVVTNQQDSLKNLIKRHNIDIIAGTASFDTHPNTLRIAMNRSSSTDQLLGQSGEMLLEADKFLISVGSHPIRRPDIVYDDRYIIDSDIVLSRSLGLIPRHLVIIGAGIIGMEYASMMSVIPSTRVTIIDSASEPLSMVDREIICHLEHEMRNNGVHFLMNETVLSVKRGDLSASKDRTNTGLVDVKLASGKCIKADCVLYAVGRQGRTEELNLPSIGIKVNSLGLVPVNDFYQTAVGHVYAAGDVVGFPALASTAMEQGRIASCHMWDGAVTLHPYKFPLGIFTVPEISMVGKTEEQLTKENVSYEVGIARYTEIAKGQMSGAGMGMLKMLFHSDTLQLLGIHCIGEQASEIVHIGQAAMDMACPITFFMNNVFNYPTFAECYRVAAFNGMKRKNYY